MSTFCCHVRSLQAHFQFAMDLFETSVSPNMPVIDQNNHHFPSIIVVLVLIHLLCPCFGNKP